MANGDKAAAKGWTVVPSTDDFRVGYDDINYSMDRTADEIDARTSADLLKLDAAKLIISATTPAVINGAVWLKPL